MTARAFTLLEVMVAVAILGMALTVILSAQAGLYAAGSNVQNESVAIGLARCKMGEVEEELTRMGYPEVDEADEGECCEDQSQPGMRCVWKIETVELPDPPELGETNPAGGSELDLGAGLSGDPSGMMPGGTGSFGALFGAGADDAGLLRAAGGADGGFQALSSMMGGAASGGVAGLAPLVMSIVYPSLKPMLEASIRKVTVSVKWRQGKNERDLTVVQYLTSPMKMGIGAMMMEADGGTEVPGTFSGGGAAGSGPAIRMPGGR